MGYAPNLSVNRPSANAMTATDDSHQRPESIE